MFRFPWGDMHSLNLGWFLQKFNELREDWATAEAGIDGALDAEIQKAEDALSDVFAARDAAAASASAANSSALNASQSSLASMDARDQSIAARNTAQQAAASAAASETAADNSATAASNSATAAAGSATAAGQSATNAAGSATAAGQSATNAAASETAAGNSASAAAASETNAAASEAAAAASAASIGFVDISSQITLDTTNFTILDKSIIRFKEMVFFSIRAKANSTALSLQLWSNMPIDGTMGPDASSAWVRCPEIAIGYGSNIADPYIVPCAIGDKTLRLKNTTQNHYYEVSGFFKSNLT